MHELGHVLDERYQMRKVVLGRAAAMARKEGRVGGAIGELRALAALRMEGEENPTDAFKNYINQRDEQGAVILEAYLHARERMQDVAPTILKALETFIGKHPELAPLRDIKPSLVMKARQGEVYAGGLVERGRYYMPEPDTQVLDNYLSPGLSSSGIYRGLYSVTKGLNMAQLGASAFHLMFTSLDAATSKNALAIQYLSKGYLGHALVAAAQAPLAPVTNFLQGRAGIREYYSPGSNPAITALVNAVIERGHQVRLDSAYTNDSMRKFADAVRAHDVKGAILHLPGAAVETVAYPIMQVIVPAQKMGVALDLARMYIEALGPDAPEQELTNALTRAIDSVDNRMGQLVYDNLFVNRTFKDLGMLTTRSLGWNIGTVRELGGALDDAARQPFRMYRRRQVIHGKLSPEAAKAEAENPTPPPEVTTRMAYLISLPLTMGLAGMTLSLIYHIMNGAPWPRNFKDLIFVRTGRKLPNGED